jgi:hypothetical protein
LRGSFRRLRFEQTGRKLGLQQEEVQIKLAHIAHDERAAEEATRWLIGRHDQRRDPLPPRPASSRDGRRPAESARLAQWLRAEHP